MLFQKYTPDLNETDLAIYNFIIDDPEKINHMRIRDLAIATHTSTASILRLCKKFGCNGFSEFKVRLSLFLEEQKDILNYSQDRTMLMNFIDKTNDSRFQKLIDQAVEIIKNKKMLIVIGDGFSGIMARYASNYFSAMCIPTFCIDDPHNYPISYFEKDITKDIAIIALSVSGENHNVIQYLTCVELGKCPIISITNTSQNQIAQLSTINIPYFINKENVRFADITSQVPALFIIELLAKKLHTIK